MVKKAEFIDAFAGLGRSATPSESQTRISEKFVCSLYGNQCVTSVNELRYKMFMQRFEKDNKITDLSLFPPCKSNLRLHVMRANYVAWIYRNACSLIIEPEPTENAGWDEDCNVQWSLDSYPDDVAEMLIDHDNNSSDDELDVIEDDNLDESDEDENFIDSF